MQLKKIVVSYNRIELIRNAGRGSSLPLTPACNIHICGKSHPILASMAEVTSAISIDASVDKAEAKEVVGHQTAVCGNLAVNTVLLLGTPKDLEKVTRACIDKGADILTTSCGISPASATANLQAMVQAVKNMEKQRNGVNP